jgi:hypothetical protein
MNAYEIGKKSVELHERKKQCYEEPKERIGYNPYTQTSNNNKGYNIPKPKNKKIRIKIPKETKNILAIIFSATIIIAGMILNNINITITGCTLIIMIAIKKFKEEQIK